MSEKSPKMSEKMRGRGMMNAMRSGLVVFGALAFGYLTLQLGFRPYLERAQRTLELEKSQTQHQIQIEKQQQQQQPPFEFSDSDSSSSSTN